MKSSTLRCCLLVAVAALLGNWSPVSAQAITLAKRFASWDDPEAWITGEAARDGQTYSVTESGQDLTTPRAFGPVFPDSTLNIGSGGNLDLRHFGGSASIADLVLNGGAITHGTGRTVGIGGLGESLSVTADSRVVVVRNSQTLEVRSSLTGAGGLVAQGASVEPGDRATIALLGGDGGYTGGWTVANVTLKAVTPGSMGSGNVLITEGTLDFDYRYHNAEGSLTIQGAESRLLLDQDIAFAQVFFGETPLPDGVHPWSFFDELGAGEQILDGGGRLIIGDQDSDDDGMIDVLETELLGDLSKVGDGDEDGDGLTNGEELQGKSDPMNADTDGDGLGDAAEIAAGADPSEPDTDGDGLSDLAEVETEGTNPSSPDTDGDSLLDGEEVGAGTSPLLADSDADGFDDGTENSANSDPNDAEDKPSGSFIPAQVEIGAPVLLAVRFDEGGDPIATKEANMALNTDEPEILFVTTSTDAAGLTDPVTGEEAQQAVVGFFMDPRTLEQTREPFVILGNPDAELRKLDVRYNPISKQYVVATSARDYRPNNQVVPLIALVNPNSVAGDDDPVAKAFSFDGDTAISYDDVALAVSSNNGNILLVAEYKFAGEGEGVVGAMFDKDGNVLTPNATRLDRLQAIGDEDDPDVLFLPNNDVFVFLVNTDGDGANDLKNRITGSVIQSVPDGNGNLQLGEQVVLGSDRLEGNREGHPAAIENPFTDELIGAFDYANGDDGGDLFYFQVGGAPGFELTTTRDQEPYLEAAGNDPYNHRHPQLAADPNSGVIVVGHHARSSAADPTLPNGYAITVLGPDGAVLPGRDEIHNGFHAFLENESETNNDANWTNVKYDPLSDSFIAIFADTAGETKVVRFTVLSNHLEQPVTGGEGEEPDPEPGPLFSEDFESLTLGPNVDEGVAGEMVWTNEAPSGWAVDNSELFGFEDEGIGVTEWKGWAFASKDWWIEAAGDQRRSEWLTGEGTVAIADPDEWDDLGGPGAQEQGGFNTFMSTPPISLEGVAADTAVLSFDSSWRPEFDDNYHQSANLKVSFDGGEPIELFEWLSDPNSPNFKGAAIDEKVVVLLNNPEGAENMVITFGMFDAGNDWWWAIDNIVVTTGCPDPEVIARPSGLTLNITETSSCQLDLATIELQVDGTVVDPDIVREDGIVTVRYQPVPPFVAGSAHNYVLVAQDQAGGALEFGGDFDVPEPILPGDPLPGVPGVDGGFGVRYIWGGGSSISNIRHAVEAIQSVEAGTWPGAFFDTTHTYINHGDGNGLFPEDDGYPEEVELDEDGLWTDEDFVQFAKGTIFVPESGEYTFGVQTDDGFAFRILGAEFTKVQGQGLLDPGSADTMAHPGTTGNSSTRGIVSLTRGEYDIELMWFERGGGDFGELYVARGAFEGDAGTDTWQLVGLPGDGQEPYVVLIGGALPVPVATEFVLDDDNVTVFFETPEPENDHALESSKDLLEWAVDPDAVLSDLGDGLFSMSVARATDAELYYRVKLLPPPPLLADDFESGVGDWTVETLLGETAWELGTPNVEGLTEAASGTNAWGTGLDANYGPGTVTSLRSPVIDLTGIGRPKLSFNYYIDSTPDAEGGQLRFLSESGEVLFTREEIFSGKTDAWTPFSVTIPREARDQRIQLEFRFLTDGDEAVGGGWFLDDVVVDR